MLDLLMRNGDKSSTSDKVNTVYKTIEAPISIYLVPSFLKQESYAHFNASPKKYKEFVELFCKTGSTSNKQKPNSVKSWLNQSHKNATDLLRANEKTTLLMNKGEKNYLQFDGTQVLFMSIIDLEIKKFYLSISFAVSKKESSCLFSFSDASISNISFWVVVGGDFIRCLKHLFVSAGSP